MTRPPAGARRGRRGAGRPARTGPWLGRELEVEVGPVAHGGHCVARHEGRVVFVRHALPGEHVRVRVTEDRGGGFCRADAVEVLTAAPGRVPEPCPHAGPGRCGGCDWQHATGDAQRALKAAVVREQLTRLAGLPDVPVTVEELPGGLLGWRTRVRYAVDPAGRTALRRHRSHELEPVARCPLGTDGVAAAGVGEQAWPAGAEVEVVASSAGDTTVLLQTPGPGTGPAGRSADAVERAGRPGSGTRAGGGRVGDSGGGVAGSGRVGDSGGGVAGGGRAGDSGGGVDPRLDGGAAGRVVDGPAHVREQAGGRDWTVSAGGFWQVHPAAADTLSACVLDMLAPRPGETALDLYAGAGLFAGLIAAAVGPTGHVVAVEADPRAAADARVNLAATPGAADPAAVGPGGNGAAPAAARPRVDPGGGGVGPGGGARVEVRAARVTAGLLGGLGVRPDIAVLDPPRSGAGPDVLAALLALGPRAVAYVSCDPAALARDLRAARDAGWRLAGLRAFDCFPMTAHVETVAHLVPA